MLKQVGASGQISLRKKYAGQLFNFVLYPDSRAEMVPVKVVQKVQGSPSDSLPSGTATVCVQQDAAAYRVGMAGSRVSGSKQFEKRLSQHCRS